MGVTMTSRDDREATAAAWFQHFRDVLYGRTEPLVVPDNEMHVVVIQPPSPEEDE